MATQKKEAPVKLSRAYYSRTFQEYPDVVTIPEIQQMLRTGRNKVYTLLKENKIQHRREGRDYIVAKANVIEYLFNGG